MGKPFKRWLNRQRHHARLNARNQGEPEVQPEPKVVVEEVVVAPAQEEAAEAEVAPATKKVATKKVKSSKTKNTRRTKTKSQRGIKYVFRQRLEKLSY